MVKEDHFKSDCNLKAQDRDSKRPGGPIFRADIKTVPEAKKARMGATSMMAVKTLPFPEPDISEESLSAIDNATLEELMGADDIDKAGLEFTGDVPLSDNDDKIVNQHES